ncbi:MAG: cytochrome P450 [Acidimicrobiales bacterium]
MEAAGDCDIVDLFFKPLPSFVVSHYLGVPREDRARFDNWSNAIVAANAASDYGLATQAFTELFAYGDELIEMRRHDPGDDLVSLLVQAGSENASPGWIVGFVFTMVTGGNDTTTGLLGGAAELLTAHPDQRRVLLDDPDLVTPAVDEFLRLTSPVQNLARTTTREVELHDRIIPAGVKVLLLYGSANRDEARVRTDRGRPRRSPTDRQDPLVRVRRPPLPRRRSRTDAGLGRAASAARALPGLPGRCRRGPIRPRRVRAAVRVVAVLGSLRAAGADGYCVTRPRRRLPVRDRARP